MKRGKLLNAELNQAIASIGHNDYMICTPDYPVWFAKPGVTVPAEYIEVVERMKKG